MPGLGVIGRFFGNAAGETAAFAAGAAITPTLRPVLQALENETWAAYPVVPPEAVLLAEGLAQGQVTKAKAYKWAAETGIGTEAMDALVNIANTGPGMGQAFNLWRRDKIDEPAFRRALKRLGLEQEWIDALVKVKTEPLDPADLARAIHKSIIPDPGLLAVPQPAGEGRVKAYPVYPVDALAEAEAAGFDKEHLGVLVGLQGNPMGAHEAAQAVFRNVLDPVDYDRAIAEGNTRNEWGPAIFEQSRQIPSPTNYIEGFVRDWISKDEMRAGAARHGMTQADADFLFLIHGRPLSWHQVFIGLARGGIYDGPTTDIDPAFLKALRESNIRPEWYHLAWAQRYSYPAAFVLRKLATDGDITEAETVQILLYEGWEPTLAAKVAHKWSTTPPTIGARGKLSAAEIRTARHRGHMSESEALTRLEALGYSQPDAVIYLANSPHSATP